MSEDLSQAVPAVSADSEAVPPVRAVDSDDPAVLRAKILKAKADRDKATEEKLAYKKQVQDMERQLSERDRQISAQKQQELIEKEDYKGLHAALKINLDDVSAERDAWKEKFEQSEVQRQQDQIRVSATNLFAQSGVNMPEHLMKILGENMRLDENGAVVILAGGVQVPLNQHIQNLKAPGSGFENFFIGSGARGMSASGQASATSGQASWDSMSFSEQVAIEMQDPEKAARLKAQG